MGRAEFKTIIAPKPTIVKLEKYKESRSLPSNSQALVEIISEFERSDGLIDVLKQMLKKIQKAIRDLKDTTSIKSKKIIADLMELLTTILDAIIKTKSR